MKIFVATFMGLLAALAMAATHWFLQVDQAYLWLFMTVGFVSGFIGSIASRT